METIYLYILYFLSGVLQDILFTLNVRYVAKERVLPAVISSFMTVMVSMLVLYNIITGLNRESGIVAIAVYAFGIAVGTFVAMKFKVETIDK